VFATIERLVDLRAKGIINDDEFANRQSCSIGSEMNQWRAVSRRSRIHLFGLRAHSSLTVPMIKLHNMLLQARV